MKLSELISTYGDDKVGVQYLDQCADKLSMRGSQTTIQFGTQEPLDFTRTARLGIVVWLDRDRVKEIIAAEKVAKS